MFVGVYYHDDALGGYKIGRAYTYHTAMNLKPGDRVICPTAKNPMQRGMVAEINLPQPAFACRSITEYDTEKTVTADE